MVDNIGGSASSEDGIIKEQDQLLPIANVGRIMKQILPPNAKISKEAKETMQECVSEFISFVTSEASEKCRKERRKTVNGDDICWALGTLGFDDYSGPLKRYLNRYRDMEGEKANNQGKVSNSEEMEDPPSFRTNQQPRNQAEASTSVRFLEGFLSEGLQRLLEPNETVQVTSAVAFLVFLVSGVAQCPGFM